MLVEKYFYNSRIFIKNNYVKESIVNLLKKEDGLSLILFEHDVDFSQKEAY